MRNDRNFLTLDKIKTAAIDRLMAEGEHPAVMILITDRAANIIPIDNTDTAPSIRSQMSMYAAVAALAIDTIGEIEQMFFISEIWMSAVERIEELAVMPSEDPNRREGLIVSTNDFRDDTTQHAVIEMFRDADGRLIELKEDAELDEADSHGSILDEFVTTYRRAIKKGKQH